jgi:hypothetical protein
VQGVVRASILTEKLLLKGLTMKKYEKATKKELIDFIQTIRPKSDCYDRICQSLGITNNILGHIKQLQDQIKQLQNKDSAENKEPLIINGTLLTIGQSMTIRVAIEGLALDLHEDGLGEDKHGKTMTKLYQDQINEIRSLIFKKKIR